MIFTRNRRVSRQQRGLDTRARILEAAVRCFARTGYDGTGVAEICDEAAVSKGAFYHHFPSKQAVFLAVLHEWLSGLGSEMEKTLTSAPSVPEGLQAVAGIMPSVLSEAQGQVPLFLEFWLQASRDPVVWKATIAPYERYRQFFSDLVSAGMREGTLRPVDPQVAGAVIVSFAVGLFMQGALDPAGSDWPRVAQQGIRILLDGMSRQGEDRADSD
jgi:AcrR family transcriptional regulator